MQKTIIGKFPPRNPQQQQQHQPRLGHGQNNLSPVESHYVILPPETMPPAADPLIISKIYQAQSEGICAPSEDSPCSLPTVRMISSGSFTTISHPLSALPLQFQADPEDDDYTREAKEQAAWEATALMEAEAAPVSRGSSAMDVQHQSAKRPRTLTDESPDQEGKVPAHVPLLLTNGDPETLPQPSSPALLTGSEISQEIPKHSTRRYLPDSSTPPPLWPPTVEGHIPIAEVPICQFLADFRASLFLKMQSVYSSPSHATLRPGLEGLTSTVLIALVGLEKTLQQPFYSPGVAPSPDSHPPPQPSPPLSAASHGVHSLLSERPASPTLGPFAVPPHSWAKVVARSTLPVDSPPSPPDHPLSDPANAWSPAESRRGRERKQRDGAGPVATPLTLSANRGQVPLNGTQTSPGRNSPSRAQNRTPGYSKPATPTAVPPRRGLRALLAPTPPQADGSVSPPAAEDIQKVLFAAPAATPAPAAMETEDALQSTRKKTDEAVTYLHVACPNFSAAARKEPREAWRLLLLAQSKVDSQRLRPLDILPVSATAAEIFIPESQLPVYREALQQFVIDTPRPLTEAADFRRRATAYRNSYFKSYRRATLLGFSPELREDFLFSLWNDVQNPIGPPPSKYRNLQWIVKQDLLEFNLLSGQTEY